MTDDNERAWQDKNGWSGYIHRKSYEEIQKEALNNFLSCPEAIEAGALRRKQFDYENYMPNDKACVWEKAELSEILKAAINVFRKKEGME